MDVNTSNLIILSVIVFGGPIAAAITIAATNLWCSFIYRNMGV